MSLALEGRSCWDHRGAELFGPRQGKGDLDADHWPLSARASVQATPPPTSTWRLTHLRSARHLWDVEVMTRVAKPDAGGLIEFAASGDDIAFARIVAENQEDTRRVCAVVCGDDGLAEEAVAAAWPIAWRKLGSVRDPERLRPWLVSVAVNEAKHLLRQRRRRSKVEVTAEALRTRAGVDPATAIDLMDLRAAMERLDVDDQALVAMRYVAGFDATELSAAIGISPAGTRTRLKRLLDRLRQELA